MAAPQAMSNARRIRAFYVCLTVVALAGCALPLRLDAPHNVGPIELAPGEHHEDCVRLATGDRVLFRFEASPAAAFSVRYRSGEAQVFPFIRPPTESDSGFFVAAETHSYCFDWVADATATGPTRLSYHLSLERKP